jgi:hypothetical protein
MAWPCYHDFPLKPFWTETGRGQKQIVRKVVERVFNRGPEVIAMRGGLPDFRTSIRAKWPAITP